MKKLKLFVSTLALTALVAACAPKPATEPEKVSPTKSPEKLEVLKSQPVKNAPPADCPVTISTDPSFEAPAPYSSSAPWPGMFWFGAEHLWTALQTNGVWEGLPHNPEGYTQKIMWWSSLYILKDELKPALVVTGRRLDAEAPPLKFDGATNAFAKDIGDAMLTGVNIPSEGCWEITGQYKKSGLTFVVWIAP